MEKSTTRKWLVISGSVLAAWIVISLVILSGGKGDPKLKVAALQPNYGKPAFQDKTTTDTSRVEDLTKWASEAAGSNAQIVFTPEMMFNFDPQENYKSELQALQKKKVYICFSITLLLWKDSPGAMRLFSSVLTGISIPLLMPRIMLLPENPFPLQPVDTPCMTLHWESWQP